MSDEATHEPETDCGVDPDGFLAAWLVGGETFMLTVNGVDEHGVRHVVGVEFSVLTADRLLGTLSLAVAALKRSESARCGVPGASD